MQIVIGSRVHCILYGGRDGVVYAIHGEQQPASVRSLGGGVVMMGGSAEFDIVWQDGTESHRVPECIMRGVQWRVLGEVVTADVIAFMREFASIEEARRRAEAEEAARKYSEAVASLKNDQQYAHLKRADGAGMSGGKLVAINLRAEFKKSFPGVKFSVTSDYNSVRIGWTDGPTTAEVKAITAKYEAGHFDGMDDSYHYSRHPFSEVFGSAQYIFENRHYSEATMRAAVSLMAAEYGCAPLTVKVYNDGEAYVDCREHEATRDLYDYLERRHEFATVAA